MPRLDGWAWLLWAAIMAAHWVLLGIALKLRLYRSVTVYLALRSVVSTILLLIVLIDMHWLPDWTPPAYFYVYWGAKVITCGLHVWIITDLACSACTADEMLCGLLRRVIPGMAGVGLFIAVMLMSGQSHGHPNSLAIFHLTTVTLWRIVPLTALIAFLIVGCARQSFGLRLPPREGLLALGLFGQMCGEFVASWLIGFTQNVLIISNLQSLLHFCSLVAWFIAFTRSEEYSISSAELVRISEPILSAGQKLRGL